VLADVLLYAGSGVLALWGGSHVASTRAVVRGFGDISPANVRVLTMEWVAEGLTHMFVALVVVLVTSIAGSDAPGSLVVFRAGAGFLIAIGVLTALTGARTPVVWCKLCPVVMSVVAAAYLAASVL